MTEVRTHHQRHLYPTKGMKETQLQKAINILELISVVKDRQVSIVHTCKTAFGRMADGTKATDYYAEKYNHNTRVISRLKQYYNNTINSLIKF